MGVDAISGGHSYRAVRDNSGNQNALERTAKKWNIWDNPAPSVVTANSTNWNIWDQLNAYVNGGYVSTVSNQ